uniref:Uncharacterized protein LOC111113814 n=1 Tax=Crassostrea virginica TaxID=6565 RepID=A0A8B8BWR6_CRAVI|nr:uncharacterized protein LOC111113814 [Crassostrea virginica]
MPVPMIQGNVTIVDTPGIGDDDQEDVARRMMNYLQNALAVVFIINVANAGGVQNDRLVRIIKHIRDSMTGQMFCFSPEDTLFVLNKWDSIEDDEENEEFFESTKTKLQTIWREVDDRHILKLSAIKALKQNIYKTMFANFKRTLQEVITKNKNKRVEVHLE